MKLTNAEDNSFVKSNGVYTQIDSNTSHNNINSSTKIN